MDTRRNRRRPCPETAVAFEHGLVLPRADGQQALCLGPPRCHACTAELDYLLCLPLVAAEVRRLRLGAALAMREACAQLLERMAEPGDGRLRAAAGEVRKVEACV